MKPISQLEISKVYDIGLQRKRQRPNYFDVKLNAIESLDVIKLQTVWMSQMKTDARSFYRKKITKE